ncbi:phage tail protein [Klebsiella pasteurii]|uniref:phage tail protein n=1 Tax=Klebsiella pasteurii TaxID=2587529 RepID=UPI0029D5CDFE|nr:phage tail protein [Klebsiella pasteurii]MDX7157275.1 phage tail protein [Klebsiella pasteurii]
MSERRFYSMLTQAGAEKIAQAQVSGVPAGFVFMAVGDGGGIVPSPSSEQTGLINEVWRAELNSLTVVDEQKNIIQAEAIMPPQVGGFTMREVALFDEEGVCLAVGSLPVTYKPTLSEGSGRFSVVRIWLAVSSTEAVQLTVDTSVIMASREDVDKAKDESMDYTDKALQEAIADAITAAKRDFWEDENPVGTVKFYAQNVNPNERYPWSTWTYTGENKTIRVGKADGSDVATTGGSDTVTIQRANLPAEQVAISGTTSNKDAQELTTSENGSHTHGGVASRVNPWEIGGDISQQFNPANLGETDAAGNHNHTVTVPAHNHTVSGNTDNLGSGQAISVVEAHVLLMCWARVA